MAKKRKLRVGIIGCGGIARGPHAAGWQRLGDEADVVATCDIERSRAQALAETLGAREVFTDFKDLVKLKGLDAVDICTPNRLHTPAVLAALNAGLHVLCEKPLAVTTAEVRKMGRLADRKKRKLMTAQHQRYRGETLAARRFVESGALGKPLHARVYALRRNLLPNRAGFIDEKLSGGGPCMDIGVHALDAGMWLMGFPTPVRVTGSARTNFAKGHDIPGAWGEWDRKQFNVEDWASGFVHFDTGLTMVLEACWLAHREDGEEMSNRIFGSKASLEWPTGNTWSAHNGVLCDGVLKPVRTVDKPHTAEIVDFFRCVTERKPSPIPWQETIKVIAILEGIYRSEREGREVRIRLP